MTYIGPSSDILSSTGLGLTGINPLPVSLPEDALVIVSGAVDEPLGATVDTRGTDGLLESEIVDWLRRTIRPGIRLSTICSGAL